MKDLDINIQRQHKCLIHGCPEMGRKIGSLAGSPLSYCPKHRKYGERVINFLIDSSFRGQLMKFLDEVREDLFQENKIEFCEECQSKVSVYVLKMSNKLKELDNGKPEPEL